MSASDHLQPHQLQMFMPAKQILDSHNLGDHETSMPDHSPAGKQAVMAWKQRENAAPFNERGGTGADFSGGIHTPVEVLHEPHASTLVDGHHRLAHALSLGPHTEVPVEHTDRTNPHRIRDHVRMKETQDMRKRAMANIPKGAY